MRTVLVLCHVEQKSLLELILSESSGSQDEHTCCSTSKQVFVIKSTKLAFHAAAKLRTTLCSQHYF